LDASEKANFVTDVDKYFIKIADILFQTGKFRVFTSNTQGSG